MPTRTAGSGSVGGRGRQRCRQGRLPVQRLCDAAVAVGAAVPRTAVLMRVRLVPQIRHGVVEGAMAPAMAPGGALAAHRRAEESVTVGMHRRVVVEAVLAVVPLGLRVRRRPGAHSELM